jgi:acetyltransferase
MKNGETVVLRPIRPEDEPLEAEMFTHFSQVTQRFRFFTLIKDITHELLIRYTQIDYDRETAIIAEIESQGRKIIIGAVRLIEDVIDETAEFAIVVADAWQKKGLGEKLADQIIRVARQQGLKKIYLSFLKDNYAIKSLVKKEAFKIIENPDYGYAELILNN